MKHFTNTNNPIDFPTKSEDLDAFIDGYAERIENMTDEEWETLGESKLIHAKGNLLDLAEAGDFDIVIQGCNCFNTMGGGIAREIAQRYPHVAEVDAGTARGDYTKLGNWTTAAVVTPESGFVVINAYTQYGMSNGEDVFEYTAFDMVLQKLSHLHGTKRFGLPYIGMGLANGDRDVIMNQIEYFAEKVAAQGGSVTLVEFG